MFEALRELMTPPGPPKRPTGFVTPEGKGKKSTSSKLTTANVTFDTGLPVLPKLKLGVTGRWQSKNYKEGGAHQDAYFLAHGFAAYDLTDRATMRLNVNNLFDKKYINGLSYGAIYGAPRNAMVTLSYAL